MNSCRTREPRGPAGACAIVGDADTLGAHLEDAAHYPGGHAAGIAYPRSEADVAAVLRATARVLPIGAQSSLTGGATPFGEVLLATGRLNRILEVSASGATVEAGVTLDALQSALSPYGAAYPPVPTFTGACAGGAAATNAAGAATFKYGSTRDWITGLTVVLAGGEVLDLERGACRASASGFDIRTSAGTVRVPLPSYRMPDVQKRSAGYFAAPEMDLVDLFIGSEGTLGIITSVTVRTLTPAPAVTLALVFPSSQAGGFDLVSELRRSSIETWRGGGGGIDACAIEHIDRASLDLVRAHGDIAQLGIAVPADAAMALLIQLEVPAGTDAAAVYEQVASALSPGAPDTGLVRFCRLLDRFALLDRAELAAPGDQHRQQQLMRFRESVPARVNQQIGAVKRTADARIEKVAADMIVPFDRLAEMMDIYRAGFESRGLAYAIWGHISDGNLHPNVLPRCYDDVVLGKEAILEFGRDVARLGGCPLAEHGVGRNPIKQALLRQLYGEHGIEQMRRVKRALDPEGKLAPGVIFPW